MAAQPLAWFDAADLPPDAFALKILIGRYRSVQHDFHEGYILPIGEEPSGKWISIHKGERRLYIDLS